MAQGQENKKVFYLVLIGVLVLLNGFFAYKHATTKKELVKTIEEKNELDSLLTVAKGELTAHQARNAELQGKNAELDSLLTARQDELQKAVTDLEKLKKEGSYTRKQLQEAKDRVSRLQAENDRYAAKVDSLNTQVQFLTKERDSLNTGLIASKNENQLLLSEKDFLSRKVQIGSLLIPENIEAGGVFMKSTSARPTTKAKKTEKLQFCFDVPENKVAEPGSKTIVIRVLNPQGATIAVESQGSGSFTTASGEQMQYTLLSTFDYANQKKRECVTWEQTQAYGSGTYQAIFYQDGHEIGKQSFELK